MYRESLTPIADKVFHPVTQGSFIWMALVMGAYDFTHMDADSKAMENEQETVAKFEYALTALQQSNQSLQSRNNQLYNSAVNTLLHNTVDDSPEEIQPESLEQSMDNWTSAVILSPSLSEKSKESLLNQFNKNIDHGEDIDVAAAFLDECRAEQADNNLQAAANNKVNAHTLADNIAECSMSAYQSHDRQLAISKPEDAPYIYGLTAIWIIGLYGLFGGRGIRNAVARTELKIGNKVYNWKREREERALIRKAKH